jgi:hypothetical protein
MKAGLDVLDAKSLVSFARDISFPARRPSQSPNHYSPSKHSRRWLQQAMQNLLVLRISQGRAFV